MDNASNNDAMINEIQTLLPSDFMTGPTTQVRCFGHVLGLASKAFCSVFNNPLKAKKRAENNDGEASELDSDGDDEIDGDEEGNDMDEEHDSEECQRDEESEEDIEIPNEDNEDGKEEYDEDAEWDAEDDAEILELDKNLKEVRALSSMQKRFGSRMVTKVCKDSSCG
jgi:hypothetical protein